MVFFYIALIVGGASNAYPLEKKTQFLIPESNMMHPLPACLAGKPVYHLKTLAVQKDGFSCGYHALFHALAFDKAVYEGNDFVYALKRNLSDSYLFFDMCGAVKKHIGTNQPLNGAHIIDVAEKFPLGQRLLSLFFEQNEIMIPRLNIVVGHPLSASQAEIQEMIMAERKRLVHDKVKQLVEVVKEKRNQAAYFICNVGNHYMLCSVVSDFNAKVALYIIGSHNEPLNENAVRYINFLLSYMKS